MVAQLLKRSTGPCMYTCMPWPLEQHSPQLLKSLSSDDIDT